MMDPVRITVKSMKMVNVSFVNDHYVFDKNVKKKSNVRSNENDENYKMTRKNLKRKEIKLLEHF